MVENLKNENDEWSPTDWHKAFSLPKEEWEKLFPYSKQEMQQALLWKPTGKSIPRLVSLALVFAVSACVSATLTFCYLALTR